IFTHFEQVLYTHQKTKKSKTWQDGILRIRSGRNKAVLLDDKGQCLESIFIKSQVNAGDNLESERYLITVEAVKANEESFEDQPRKVETSAVDRDAVKPGVLPPRHLSVGLKRKFTGFQVPRQVEKKISTMEDGENPTILPLSKQCQGTFPSKFYTTSPLFSTIGKKDVETNPSADFDEDACTDNDREHMSISSLLSATFLNRCEETEKQNSHQSLMKPESPLIPGHAKFGSQTADHRAVSHNIRSTSQIIALLKSKPTQGCREQTTSEVVQCHSVFQASKNTDNLHNQKCTILPAFSDNPAKRLIQNISHLSFMKATVNDKKECNAEVLLNSAEQPCDKEVTGQRHDKKVCNLSQDLQNPCNTNRCFLHEFTISRMSDSQFVPSSGDVSCSASPVTLGKSVSRYREHSGANGLEENPSEELQRELQPRQNSESDLDVDVALSETGVGEGVPQSSALRHSPCEVVTPCENEEAKSSTFDGKNDGNHCAEGIPPQLCDNDVGDMGRIAEDSANQARTEVELVGDGHKVNEVNESQLSIEATTREKDLDGCAGHPVNGTSWIKSNHSHLLPGDTDVNKCHPKTSMFEKTESISCIHTRRILSAIDKRTEDDAIQPGCIKSPDVDLELFLGVKNSDIKPDSPLLALSGKSDSSYSSFQYFAEDHQKVFGISHKEDTVMSRSSIYPLGKGCSSPEETAIGETEFESVESINALHKACKGERRGTDCLKRMAMAQNSSYLPDLVNNIALLRALTQHSTALESLQKMEENVILYET
ncbi:ZGRF1 protein, partial [Geococcyx californianus]|nr:ZGRF1 protein [Geococcyx californianus]